MKTDIPTNGSMVKNHISLKTGFGLSATPRTLFLSWLAAKLTFFWTDDKSFFSFFVLRGTQRISTVCPTAGAQALVMSHVVCHDIRATQGQHCTAECRFSLCEH